MPINCPNPNFPTPVPKPVLSDPSFSALASDGSPTWQFENGWVNISGIVVGTAVTSSPSHKFIQEAINFRVPYGTGDDDISEGESYICEFRLSSVNIDVWGVFAQIRPIWGGIAGEWKTASPGLKTYSLTAPSGGLFQLKIKSGIGFYGSIPFCNLSNFRCVPSSEVETGGSGGDIGSGGVGGIVLQAGETPNTGFSSKYYGEDREEIFSTDMRIFDNEIDDDFGRDSLGGQ